MPRTRRAAAAVLAATLAALTLAACGGSEEGSGGAAGSAADDDAFPVTIGHTFGETTIEERPERVVTIGFNEQDFALALGVTPVGVRENLGDYDATQRPWAVDLLPDEPLPTVGGEELDLEAIAALDPDLILGVYSFIDESTYELLSDIAPTVAESADHPTGGTPWQEQTRMTGLALGAEDEAEALVADVEGRFAAAVEEHPEFAGKTLALDFLFETGHYILEESDLRTRFFLDLGFTAPEQQGEVSAELLGLLDQDVLVPMGADRATLTADPLFSALAVVSEDRTVYLGDFSTDFAGALGYSSPLSLPYALEVAVPLLAAAADGDPSTVVPDYTG
ncbi:iron-siderophore ABC transporter substrate-binding protein [Geodermatophilus sp. SYSU D00815]